MGSDVKAIVKRSYSSRPTYDEVMAGVPEDYEKIGTLGELLEINYKIIPAREQIRRNLIMRKRRDEPCYPGIIGFDDDVIPALDRALLAGHDALLIGQIGQAKTRLAKTVAENLLSPMPVIKNSITNDSPMEIPAGMLGAVLDGGEAGGADPVFYVSPESLEMIREYGLETPVLWLEGADRYKYVLATPDISVKDLVGYIDAIKVAKKGVEMYMIESYSPGQLMQAKHGILCIDELPVLDPRKQVALLSVLQEGRFTTSSYPVTFVPRTVFFATANPVDYTHSGRVIEPLFDRLKSHIRTRYPDSISDEMMIILQESKTPRCVIFEVVLRVLAVLAGEMRKSERIDQERGVSVRLGIHGLEIIVGEAERVRGMQHGIIPQPRYSDLHVLSQVAKFELSDMDDTATNRDAVFADLLNESIKTVSRELLDGMQAEMLQEIKDEFVDSTFQVSQLITWDGGATSYKSQLEKFPRLRALVDIKVREGERRQYDLLGMARSAGVRNERITPSESDHSEMYAALTEAVLEGLCWTTPKVLSRRDAGYASA